MSDKKQEGRGATLVSLSYICWGTLTIFWNLLSQVNPVYILAQRVIWSMVVVGGYALLIGKGKQIRDALRNPRLMGLLLICGVLITVNWGVYIYAVNSGHVLDASLGYFIEPVLVTALGMLCFRERLNRWEKITFAFAVAGLVYLTVASKALPILALVIAGSFAAYGAVKKKVQLDPFVSLFLETLVMTPFAVAFTLYADQSGIGAQGVLTGWSWLLLPACGVVTGLPLLWFNIGVQQIPYYLSGILMYLNPTLQFMMGLWYFGEPLDFRRLVAFVLIWFGLAFTLADRLILLRRYRGKRSLERKKPLGKESKANGSI